MKLQLQRRTAVAMAAATVGVGTTGLLAGVAATGGHVLGFGSAAAHPVADGTHVVDRTKYDDERVVVGGTTAPVVTPAADTAAGASRGAATAPSAPTWNAAPPVTTTPTPPATTPSQAGHSTPPTNHGTTPGTTPATTTPTTQPPTTTAPPTTTVPPTTTTSPIAASTQTRTVPLTQGNADVSYTPTAMTVTAIHPASGWIVSDRSLGATRATIQFENTTTGRQVEWTIALRNGQLAWIQG